MNMSDTDIGRLLGRRDHSTIIHAVGKITREISADSQLCRDVLAIKEALYA